MTPEQRAAALRLADVVESWRFGNPTMETIVVLLREVAGVEVLPCAPTYTEQQIADACMAAEVPDSKFESLLLLALRA